MVCLKCNTPTHYDCLSPQYQSRLRPLYSLSQGQMDTENETLKLNIQTKRYRCENCMKCQNCETVEAGPKRHHKWSKDFKLCSKCNKMREKKLYCPVCERFQPDESHETIENKHNDDDEDVTENAAIG